jgi:hypothetical protein
VASLGNLGTVINITSLEESELITFNDNEEFTISSFKLQYFGNFLVETVRSVEIFSSLDNINGITDVYMEGGGGGDNLSIGDEIEYIVISCSSDFWAIESVEGD